MTTYPHLALQDASVLVTGGAQGIGRATAEAFVRRGARVAIGDLDLEAATRTADALGCSAFHLDVADADSFGAFVAAATAANGAVDILVNNAGVMPNGGFLELTPADDRLTMEVNVFGVLNGMRAVLPSMLERGRGHVVNVASLAGKFAIPGLATYNASKFAVVGLTAATRLEYASSGISITAVLPSAVDTALASGLDMRPIPKAKPEDIADAVVGSVSSRSAEIAVPRFVGTLASTAAVTPEPVLNAVRKLVKGDRALKTDTAERTEYRTRLVEQAEATETMETARRVAR